MANTCCWYETRIPESLMKSLLDDLDRVDENIFIKSEVNPHDSEVKDSVRKSQHCWIPSTHWICLLYTSPSPRDMRRSRMPSSA